MDAPPQPSIAILLDYLGAEMGSYIGGYQGSIFTGIKAALAGAGIPFVTYLGHALRASEQNAAYRKANDLYTLIDPSRHSGMIVLTAAMGTHVSDEEFLAFLEPFRALPMVGVGRKLPGLPTVRVDNTPGMQDMMDHLIQGRGFRRFVFMRGIEQHEDSQVRETEFLRGLSRHGLEFDPQHLLGGEFNSMSACSAMRDFLVHHRDFDAVVCANDEMAFGVMQALQDHGIRVPTEVAVVGFDDIAEAQVRIPPLTTIRQPLQELGVAAVDLLLNPGPDVFLGSQLVVRQSCGALPSLEGTGHPGQEPVTLQDPLYAALIASSVEKSDLFTRKWYNLLLDRLTSGEGLGPLQDRLMEMQLQAQQQVAPEHQLALTRLALEGHKMLLELQKVSQTRTYFGYTMTMIYQMRLDAEMLSHPDMDRLLPSLRWYLDWLEVDRYMLVLYDTFGPRPAETSRLVLSCGVPSAPDRSYPTRQLLPTEVQPWMGKHNWFVMPLFIKDEHYGMLWMGRHTKLNLDGDMPRYLISRALSQVVKVQAQQRYTEGLEQQVQLRTQELQQEVQVRIRAEKALRLANQELQRSVLVDGLTGIFNRTAFDEHLERHWKAHQHSQQVMSLILCDVDFFKKYNDLYGHLQGDQCLRQVAQTLEGCARNPDDMAARYGGEEFALILPGTDAQGAMRVAQRLQEELARLGMPHEASEVAPHITVSLGVATVLPGCQLTPRNLIQWADQALYQAKKQGRNQTVLFEGTAQFPPLPS